MKILVIAAHPDDEVMGVGGTIAKYVKNGAEVFLCVVTKAYPPDWSERIIREKRKEVLKASKILGIKDVRFLDLPTVKLDTVPQKELNERISRYVEEIRPEIVFVPHRGDLHKDHRLVFESAMVAVRPVPNCLIKKVLSYELPSSTEWTPSPENAFIPNLYVDISDTLERKIKAMSVYKTELKRYPHPRSLKSIQIYAEKRGMEAGLKAAEAFVLIREISD